MDRPELNDLIYACALGCLDNDDQVKLNELKKSDSSELSNLGELQNVISLIPIILVYEKPDAKLKDKVARKLYRMRDEIIARKKGTLNVKHDFLEKSVSENEEEISPEISGNDKYKDEETETDEELYSELNYETGKTLEDNIQTEEQKNTEPTTKTSYLSERNIPGEYKHLSDSFQEADKKKFNWFILLLVLFSLTLTIAATLFIINYFNNKIENTDSEITKLNGRIKELNEEITRLDKVQRILSVLGSDDIVTFSLDGTIKNPTGFGKIIIDPQGKEGLLQLYHMPALQSDEVYQLWLLSKNKAYSLGSYQPGKEVEYLTINKLPDVHLGDIESLILTAEKAPGSDTPGGDMYLSTRSISRNY